ncbi:MAG: L-serine ammonia-lyase, partial [Candidatus Atribacteria bacterium]
MRAPSILEILEPTVGPSSSHTLGPLLAARDFVRALGKGDLEGDRIRVTLYGSVREQVDRAAETALEHFL